MKNTLYQVITHRGSSSTKGLYESLSSPKANVKRWVFNWDLKTSKDGACRIWSGRLFHNLGATTINALSVRVGVKGWGEDSVVQENGLLIIKNKQYNKNYPVGEKQDGGLAGLARQDRARQGTTGHDRIHAMEHQWRTGTGLQTQGDYKGSKWGG